MKFIPSESLDNNQLRQDVIDFFIQEGKSCLEKVDEYNILHWLFMTSQEMKIAVSASETRQIVQRIWAHCNHCMYLGPHVLLAKDLKKALAKVPDNTPITYQRIEDNYFDNGWKTIPLQWEEKHQASLDEIEFVKNNPADYHEIINIGGIDYFRQISQYIPAFSSYGMKNDDGQWVFVINAHF